MAEKDDKYADSEEELTQVRSIIKRLNEENPSKERRREVVVRADGSKVVRVTRKRKVVVSAHDKQRASRKRFVYAMAAVVVTLILAVAFLSYRMAVMSSGAYLQEGQSRLQQLWGASSVKVEGVGMEGTAFHLTNLVAEFPESSMIERVELSGISSELELSGFLSETLNAQELKIDRALLVLRKGAQMQMPQQQGKSMWKFRRMVCQDLTVQYSDEKEAPLMLKNAHAYMYYPHVSQTSSVVILSSGTLHIKGWKTVNVREAKFHVSTSGVDDFSLQGTTDTASDVAEQRRTSIRFAGKMPEGSTMCGPFAMEADNMSLADFTKGRFEDVFTARTVAVSGGRLSEKATICLTDDQPEPVFNGEFHLKNICLSSFPAMLAVTEHIDPSKRRLYNPISVPRGYVVIDNHDEAVSLLLPDDGIVERDMVTLRGKITLNNNNELSGELNYGIPMLLARAEYPDGRPDPIFQQNGDWAVLRTRLSGTGNQPQDDMAEVEARAAIARRDRPERIPFHEFNLDRITEQMEAGKSPFNELPQSEFQKDLQPQKSSNPFESADSPFEKSVPF